MKFQSQKAKLALSLVKVLKGHKHTAYFAGGCVRDFLMGKVPVDFDIATSALPEEVEKMFPKTVAVGKQFGVILVVHGGQSFEVATFRREGGYQDGRHPTKVEFTGAEEDARRRDFTVNGLFYDPFQKRVLDFVEGQKDIRRKIIRAIGNPSERFEEDKLRILRAVRFASSLNFKIEPKTWKAVCANVSKIKQVSPERIRDELVKMFTRAGGGNGLRLLSKSGLLKIILPEIEAMKGVKQPPDYHPEGDVFVHTCLLLDQLKTSSEVLAFSALFHDIAKPVTYKIRKGRITFYEHASIGERMTREVMKRLRFSNDRIAAVMECVGNHMKFGDVQKMRSGKLKRFISRPTFETEMELHKIDCMASHENLSNYKFLKRKIKNYAKEELKPKAFLNGHDLLALGLKPGPMIRTILESVYDAQLENRVCDREQALKFAAQKVKKAVTSKKGKK